mgnify:CR=1 FL=1
MLACDGRGDCVSSAYALRFCIYVSFLQKTLSTPSRYPLRWEKGNKKPTIFSIFFFETVSDPAYSLNSIKIGAQFFAKRGNMYIDISVNNKGFIILYVV